MRIITISRQFGSGGRELGKRLSDLLGFAYYDREIVTMIAQANGLDANYVERTLEHQGWQGIPITFRHSFQAAPIMNDPQIPLLLEQRKVIEGIAAAGEDCVVVGRNADEILRKYHPLSIFVCADTEAKVKRCMDRAETGEDLTPRQIRQNMRRIDKNRARICEIIGGRKWGDPVAYDLTVNTTGWEIKALAPAVAEFARRRFEADQAQPAD